MRILHVSDVYLPGLGGIETQVHDLATQQAALGHEVEVATRTGAGPAAGDPRASAGGRPGDGRRVGVHRITVGRLDLPGGNAAVHQLLVRRRPDVVHAHLSVLSPLAILAVRAAVRRGVPVVVTVHSLWWWAGGLYRLADRVVGWGDWPVRWTAVSDLATQPLRRIIGSRGEVAVLPNAIDSAAWRVERTPRSPGEVVVISVMRLARRKRPRALLRVVREVHDRLPVGLQLRVVVVGDGPRRRAMTRRIRRSALTGVVELVGRKEPAQIRDLYREADIYLAPAVLESFGIAALEARCAGLPIVARHHTGIADFVRHGENGLLADTDRGLADAVLELASSAGLRALIGRHNAQPVPTMAWPDVLHECELSYKRARELIARTGVSR